MCLLTWVMGVLSCTSCFIINLFIYLFIHFEVVSRRTSVQGLSFRKVACSMYDARSNYFTPDSTGFRGRFSFVNLFVVYLTRLAVSFVCLRTRGDSKKAFTSVLSNQNAPITGESPLDKRDMRGTQSYKMAVRLSCTRGEDFFRVIKGPDVFRLLQKAVPMHTETK
jgi:hypothetical protein